VIQQAHADDGQRQMSVVALSACVEQLQAAVGLAAHRGLSVSDIARTTGQSPRTIRQWIRSNRVDPTAFKMLRRRKL
jgi:hypothetical protein